jgi:hypothetical protein
VRSVNLLKITAEAEILRLRAILARQARRAAFGAGALVFTLIVLALAEIAVADFAPLRHRHRGDAYSPWH